MRFLLCLSAFFWVSIALADTTITSATLDDPAGGWHYFGLLDRTENPRVAYPTPPIDRGEEHYRSMIEGQIKATSAKRQAHTLSVNGSGMNLYTDDQGRFARPFAFGAGSNSIEVRSDGKSLKRVQFYEANAQRTPVGLRIFVSSDDPKAQVDLHIITPDGQHAFYGNPQLTNGGGLDLDSVDGPGPGMFTMTAPMHGTYLVYVNYWGNYGDEGFNFNEHANQNEVITADINLVLHENTVDEKRESFIVPLRTIGDLVLVKSFTY